MTDSDSDSDCEIHKKLFYACRVVDDSCVRELLAAGAEPDKYKSRDGDTALIEAALCGEESIVSILVQH